MCREIQVKEFELVEGRKNESFNTQTTCERCGRFLCILQSLCAKTSCAGLLAGLWDFPVVPDVLSSPDSPTSTFESQAYKLIKTAIPSCSSSTSNVQIISARHVGSVEHVFSHVRKTFEVVIVELESERDEEPGVEWSTFVDEKPNEDDNEEVKKPAKKKRKFDKPQEKEGDGEEKVKWAAEDEVANAK